jgi:syntaxin 16
VATKVDEGVKQLLKAEKSQKQSGMVLCIMFLVCAIIVMLVIYILKVILFR